MRALTVATTDPPRPNVLSRLSDEDLVTRFQESGCSDSIEELVSRHLRHVRAIIFPMVLDHATADDLTQETLLRAWRGLSDFRAEARFSTWLTRIAWNVVKDEMARRERHPRKLDSVELHSTGNQPDTALLHRELDEQIDAALAELSPKLRAAIVLTGLEQFSPEEAAELEGCTISTLYWRIHEARRLLEQRLARYLEP